MSKKLRCIHRHTEEEHPNCFENGVPKKQFRPTLPKVLLFDIETAPLKAYIWQKGVWNTNVHADQVVSEWYMLCWSAKWLFDKRVYSDRLTGEESIAEDDSRISKSFWELLNQSDIVIAHNGCFAKGHKVLKSDLTWVDVADLKVGDELLAFNENVPDPSNPKSKRRFEISVVERVEPVVKKSSKVILENGHEFIVSNDHPWLVKRRGSHWDWRTTDKLIHFNGNNTLTSVIDVWNNDDNYHAGYLAAFLDGEGSVVHSKRSHRKFGSNFTITFTQKEQYIIDKLIESLDHFNFKYSIYSYDRNHRDIMNISILGGTPEKLRFLGITQSAKNKKLNLDFLEENNLYGKDTYKIKEIIDIGHQELVGLQTSSKTYIVDGFPVHNSGFDIPNMNTRFIINGLSPTKPYQTIDTLKIARKQFGFTHNSLNALARVFGFDSKLETNFQLWKDCINGSDGALRRMEKYNRRDVTLLEEIYLKLRPWIKGHPNLGLYVESDKPVCPVCGSSDIEWTGDYYYTQSGKYATYRCKCGAYGRARYTAVPKEVRKNLGTSLYR